MLTWRFGGTITLTVESGVGDSHVLDQVKDVTGRHLERFGEKDGLVVTWP